MHLPCCNTVRPTMASVLTSMHLPVGGGQGRASSNAKKKREKKRQREVILEQEDYDLLEENTVRAGGRSPLFI